jgi:hypothetical protein
MLSKRSAIDTSTSITNAAPAACPESVAVPLANDNILFAPCFRG